MKRTRDNSVKGTEFAGKNLGVAFCLVRFDVFLGLVVRRTPN